MSNAPVHPAPEILDWATSIVGSVKVVSQFAHTHGYSNLWRLRAAEDYVWLKMHAHPRKWACEVHALTQWQDSLAPKPLGWRDDPHAVLLSEMDGEDAVDIAFAPECEARLWSEAGQWLRSYHSRSNTWLGDVRPDGTPWSKPSTDPVSSVRDRIETRMFQGRDKGLLTADEFDFAAATLRDGLPSLEAADFRSIHRDFHPRNWLATRDGHLTAVIDFEHARWDVLAADLNRPWDLEFHRNPCLIDAFYEAYGRPDARFQAQIQLLRLVNLVTGIVWAVEVGEFEFSAFNRQALHRMMESARPIAGPFS